MEIAQNKNNSQITTPRNKLIECLFTKELQSIVALCYENDRPLQGFAAELDWHFFGYLSKQIKKGVITGKLGECTLLPLKKGDKLFIIYILGAGERTNESKNKPLNESIKILTKNIKSMRLNSLGLQENDFIKSDIQKINNSLSQDGKLWIFH